MVRPGRKEETSHKNVNEEGDKRIIYSKLAATVEYMYGIECRLPKVITIHRESIENFVLHFRYGLFNSANF